MSIYQDHELIVNGKAVQPNARIKDFRGKTWVFEYVSRIPEPGKSGKVTVHAVNHPETKREFYPFVFGNERGSIREKVPE